MSWSSVHIRIAGADLSFVIQQICNNGVVLQNVVYEDLLHVQATVSYSDYKQIKEIAGRLNHKVMLDGIDGFLPQVYKAKKRPILILSIFFLVYLSLWIPSRVLFISVEGNSAVLTTQILQKAEACGIRFGAKRSVVRSEVVKNNLLESMPELGWVGVNTKGCTALIKVREDISQKNEEKAVAFSNIVAQRDGIVLHATVVSGTPACSVGDVVRQGQVLVSGWQDMGLVVRTSRAIGEIFAQTERKMEIVMPMKYAQKSEIIDSETKYSFLIGKKRINFSKGSGISHTGCDKIYSTYYLSLPGGFVLPLALETECTVIYEMADYSETSDNTQIVLLEQVDQYLLNQTVSGIIQDKQIRFFEDNGVGHMVGEYICVEMIGRERIGELDIQYGKND